MLEEHGKELLRLKQEKLFSEQEEQAKADGYHLFDHILTKKHIEWYIISFHF